MAANHLVFYVRLQVKPDCIDEWKSLLGHVLENMAQEEAFVNCYWNQSTESANVFTLYETWREPSVDAFVENQMSKPYRKRYEEALPSLLEAPRDASVLQCLGEWRK
ncbi:MAG: hypothetical protein JWQ02_3127 [Capsulimonas sp.]|nr:hypothetical protein [Capsulimonas sp.]